jgi:hypothetical protein
MIRDRAWRRHKSDCFFLKRIKRQVHSTYIFVFWSKFTVKHYDPLWIDKISSKDVLIYKSIRTPKWNSRVKVKWGKKGKKNYDWSSDVNTRPKQKQIVMKELREYGY